ncbi:hypothetical protein D3C85_1073060 [compost metagenome]
MQTGITRIQRRARHAGLLAHDGVHLVHRHLRIHRRGRTFVLHAISRVEHAVQRIQRQRIHHRVRTEGHLGRIDRAMLQRAARPQERQRQDQERSHRPLPPRHERITRARREQLHRQPGRDQQHHEGSQQHALVALPQHRPDFLGVQQIDEVQAVGTRVVLSNELRRRDLQQDIEHPPDAEPPRGDASSERTMPEPGRKHGRQRDHHRQQAYVDAQSAEQQRPQAASGLHAIPHPVRQSQPGQRQQRQDGKNESKSQATHAAALRERRDACADKRMPPCMPSRTMPPR